MSYVFIPVDTSAFVGNPLTADLDAASYNINSVGTLSGDAVDLTGALITQPASAIGFFGAPPVPQQDPIPDLVGHGEVGDTINQILVYLRRFGMVAE